MFGKTFCTSTKVLSLKPKGLSGAVAVTAFSRAEMQDLTGDDLLQRGIGGYVGPTDRILVQEGGLRGRFRRTGGCGPHRWPRLKSHPEAGSEPQQRTNRRYSEEKLEQTSE